MKIGKLFFIIVIFITPVAFAAKGDLYDENIIWTKHNLSKHWPGGSADDKRIVKAINEDEICVFCHTPHTAIDNLPLWNRNLSNQQYTLYTSTTLDATMNQPMGTSRLCLSCHDGTLGMGSIINAPKSGLATAPIEFQNGIVTMPAGSGAETGDTRLLGTNLTNDHPISFVFDNNVITTDGELALPDNPIPGGITWSAYPGVKRYPLDMNGPKEAVQCTSCHNPHTTYEKFLRAPIYQESNDGLPPPTGINPTKGDPANIICLSCHKVEHKQWIDSTHAQDEALLGPNANNIIRPADALHQGAAGRKVWQLACLACHDTHTTEGADRILRNSTEGIGTGGVASLENTCFMCHASNSYPVPNMGGNPLTNDAGNQDSVIAPFIRDQFEKDCSSNPQGAECSPNRQGNYEGAAMNLKLGNNHQPVFTKKSVENIEFIPNGSTTYAHIECVDCHNPHQVKKTNRMEGMKAITIDGDVVGGGNITNVIDDRLSNPDGSYEPLIYEVCLRCHGNSFSSIFPQQYQFSYTSANDGRSRWSFPGSGNGDRTFDNFSFKGYSNKLLEFNPKSVPAWDSSWPTFPDGTRNAAFHPVSAPGRNQSQQLINSLTKTDCLNTSLSSNGTIRCIDIPDKTTNLDTTKTIQCTDCHNNETFGWNVQTNPTAPRGPISGLNNGTSYKRSTDVDARLSIQEQNDPAKPQGPHGSLNKRILRGNYDTNITNSSIRHGNKAWPMYSWMNNWPLGYRGGGNVFGTHEGQGSTTQTIRDRFELCFNCHDPKPFIIGRDLWVLNLTSQNVVQRTGFWTDSWGWGSLHYFHLKSGEIKCHECHYNVHSNVEAKNTIYGDGAGGQRPPDGNTHLINFAPNVEPCCGNLKPRWYYDTNNGYYRCQLRCHGVTMDSCKYKPNYSFDHRSDIQRLLALNKWGMGPGFESQYGAGSCGEASGRRFWRNSWR